MPVLYFISTASALTALDLSSGAQIPPPAIQVAQAPPSPLVLRSSGSSEPAATAPVPVQVEAQGGKEALWSGVLRLGAPWSTASFNSSQNDLLEPCPGSSAPAMQANRQFRVTLNARGGENLSRISVSVNWVREISACAGGGTATVGLNQTITLAPGESATIKGDAGLVIKLRRPN